MAWAMLQLQAARCPDGAFFWASNQAATALQVDPARPPGSKRRVSDRKLGSPAALAGTKSRRRRCARTPANGQIEPDPARFCSADQFCRQPLPVLPHAAGDRLSSCAMERISTIWMGGDRLGDCDLPLSSRALFRMDKAAHRHHARWRIHRPNDLAGRNRSRLSCNRRGAAAATSFPSTRKASPRNVLNPISASDPPSVTRSRPSAIVFVTGITAPAKIHDQLKAGAFALIILNGRGHRRVGRRLSSAIGERTRPALPG